MGGTEQVQTKYITDTSANKASKTTERLPSFLSDVAPYYLPAILAFTYLYVWQTTGNVMVVGLLVFVFTPLYNLIWTDNGNLSPRVQKTYQTEQMFKYPIYCTVLTYLTCHIYLVSLYSTKWQPDLPIYQNIPDTALKTTLMILNMGFFMALTIAAGHELVHYRDTLSKVIGNTPFFLTFQAHFWDEHVNHHHKLVGTPEDPVSQYQGTPWFTGIPKSIIGQAIGSWDREVRRLTTRLGREPTIIDNLLYNRMVYYHVIYCFIMFSIYQLFGWGGVKAHLHVVVQGQLWMELVNYVEHYGLRRMKDEDGIYESISYVHSWDAPCSSLASRIQRHSDHHMHVYKPYQCLDRYERAPQMPFEYILMAFMALNPPVFFYVMHPRIKSLDDARKGIHNPDSWNDEMPLTAADLKRRRVAIAWICFCAVVLVYLAYLASV